MKQYVVYIMASFRQTLYGRKIPRSEDSARNDKGRVLGINQLRPPVIPNACEESFSRQIK
jgi:hypothetical protein